MQTRRTIHAGKGTAAQLRRQFAEPAPRAGPSGGASSPDLAALVGALRSELAQVRAELAEVAALRRLLEQNLPVLVQGLNDEDTRRREATRSRALRQQVR